jgi:hypothetical protein
VIDSSASMGEHSATADAWSVAQSLIAAVTPAHHVALLELREKLELRANLSNDPVTLRAAIDEARKRAPHGPSAVYDAMVTLSRTHQGAGFPDVIYLISDCEDTASSAESRRYFPYSFRNESKSTLAGDRRLVTSSPAR